MLDVAEYFLSVVQMILGVALGSFADIFIVSNVLPRRFSTTWSSGRKASVIDDDYYDRSEIYFPIVQWALERAIVQF